jgi:hypothetical protein
VSEKGNLMSYPETIQFYEDGTLIAQAEGSPGLGSITYNYPLTIHGAEYWTRSISVEIVEVNGNVLSRMIRRVDVVKAN